MTSTTQAATRGWFDMPARQWVDLFYDLTVAAGIIAISGTFADDHSGRGMLWFAIVYALLWCTWLLTSAATGSFSSPGQEHTALSVGALVGQMGALLLLAISAGDSLAESEALFDLLLGAALLLTLLLWVRADLRTPRLGRRRPGAPTLLTAMGIAALGISWFLESTASLVLWLAALVAVAAASWAVASDRGVDSHRLVHRLGELTLIVIGEILVKLTLTVEEETVWSVNLVALIPVLAILSAIWWIYFRTPTGIAGLGRGAQRVWVGAHLPLHLGLLGLAVGLAKLTVAAPELAEHHGPVTLLAAPLTLAFGALTTLAYVAHAPARPVLVIATAALAAVCALAGGWHEPLVTAYVAGAVGLAAAAGFAMRIPRPVSRP